MIKNLHNTLLKALLILMPFGLMSQTTVTNATFPVAGDTLRVITSTELGDFDRTVAGADQNWDLTSLGDGVLNSIIYTDPMEGDSAALFPDADLLDVTVGQEIYYKTFNNKIVEIGRSGLDPIFGLINLNFINEGEAVLRRAPMSYNDAYDDSSSFSISSSADVIPDSIIGNLAGSLDSLRLTVETSHDDIVDGWGTLNLPNGNFDVLRMKRTNTVNAILEAKVVVLGWVNVDPTNPLFGGLGELLDLLGESTTTSYQFFSNDSKEIVADFTTDMDDNLISVSYKGGVTTATNEIFPNTSAVKTYPNPTFGDVTFDVQDLPADDYTVVLYNIIGKQLWQSDIDRHSGMLNVDLSQLRKGTYIYSIIDGEGRKLTSRRLIKYSF